VLLGNGNGTFQAARNFAAGSSVAVGDFNGDGLQDLATARDTAEITTTVLVLLSNGDGTFQGRSFAAGIAPVSVAVGDFNSDGRPDLAVANAASNDVSVLLGNGDGTFQAAQNFAVGIGPDSVAVGDFNGDGKPDLAVVNFGSGNISVLINNTPSQSPAALGPRHK
jgi:hypothetical protein